MGEGVAAGASARGIPALTAADGIDLLQETLHLSPANYVLSAASIPKDDQMTVVVPASHLWEPLADILRNILHVKDVSPDDNLLDLGLDSMMAVEVTAALAKHGLDVDPMVLFDNPGLDALLRHLDSIPAGGTEPTAGPPASRQPSTPPVAASPAAALLAGTTSPGGTPRTPEPVPSPSVAAPRTQASSVVDWDRFRSVTTGTEPVSGGTAVPTPVPGSPARGGTPSAPRSAPVPPSPARPAPSSAPVARFAPATEAPAYPSGSGTSPSPAPHAPMRASTGDTLRSTGRIPRRTLPGRLHDLPDGSFVDRRIDALSAEDREIIARDDYFYEPVVEDAKGAWIRFDGRWFLNLASYSYLGLIGHDYIDAQAHRAVERYGTGAHGVRLLAGTLQLHRELELTIARFLGTEDAVVFSSGYIANVATVGALVGPDDVIIGDVYNHASILDGYRLSGANVVTYAHNDLADLERALRRTEGAGRLVVTDAVFSMDGDVADLPGIVELCERHDAMLMVDEAHSLGVLGATGRGIIEHFGLDPARVPVKMGTLSKTVPSAGGYVAGSSDLIFALKNNARGWMFSAAATPAQVAAAKAAFEVMTVASHLPDELRARTDRYRQKLHQLGFDTRVSTTPVVPIYCASAEQAQAMARLCQQDGLFVQPIVYPTVPKALPRLRTIVNLSHTDGDLDEAVAILEKAGRQVGLIG
ncbi:aminotransferase class I/II-fold pyridoxal phosphate-dependent enzyme [Micromonospora nigra]